MIAKEDLRTPIQKRNLKRSFSVWLSLAFKLEAQEKPEKVFFRTPMIAKENLRTPIQKRNLKRSFSVWLSLAFKLEAQEKPEKIFFGPQVGFAWPKKASEHQSKKET